MLRAAILEAEAFVEAMGGGVGGKGIEADGLHATTLGKADGIADHLRADARALAIGADGKDVNHGHLVIYHLPAPLYCVIILALIHRQSHCRYDFSTFLIYIHAPFIDIGSDAFFRRVLTFAPSSIRGHLWRTFSHIIVESDDGVIVVLCC